MRSLLLSCLALILLASPAFGVGTPAITATFNSATDVPVTANGYTATGSTVNLALNFAPATGTQLMVVKNTALGFITGTFSNLAQGQEVSLSYAGLAYRFVANYFGGSGNDLVLHWAGTQVWGWGNNNSGQLGNDRTIDESVPVIALTSGALAGRTIIAVAAGAVHSLALCSDGTVLSWGSNYFGQLGNDSRIDSHVPVVVTAMGTALAGKTVISVAAGYGHSLALCSDGTVTAWGENFGQLGNNSTTDSHVPVAVSISGTALEGKTVIAIAAGDSYSLALCSDGTITTWGAIASGTNSMTVSLVPVAVNISGTTLEGKTVISIAAGVYHSLALCSDGTVAAWGENHEGQLGTNSSFGSPVPVAVRVQGTALAGKTVIAVSAGFSHSLALCSDGTVVVWGDDYFGVAGKRSTHYSPVPVAVRAKGTALAGKKAIAVAASFVISLGRR